MHAVGPKMFSMHSLDQGEHVTYPQHDMNAIEVFLMRFEINFEKS